MLPLVLRKAYPSYWYTAAKAACPIISCLMRPRRPSFRQFRFLAYIFGHGCSYPITNFSSGNPRTERSRGELLLRSVGNSAWILSSAFPSRLYTYIIDELGLVTEHAINPPDFGAKLPRNILHELSFLQGSIVVVSSRNSTSSNAGTPDPVPGIK